MLGASEATLMPKRPAARGARSLAMEDRWNELLDCCVTGGDVRVLVFRGAGCTCQERRQRSLTPGQSLFIDDRMRAGRRL